MRLLSSAASVAEGIISIKSVSGGINLRGSLSRPSHGVAYAFGLEGNDRETLR